MNCLDDVIDKYVELIEEAFDRVPQDYYKIKVAGDEDHIIRERVFCYELYHLIRSLQEEQQLKDLKIHGEIDKRGHALFNRDDWKNPDFVFHKAGKEDYNLIVVEVKGNLTYNGIKKDWGKLDKFCGQYKYAKGLWLVYNYSYEEVLRQTKGMALNFELGNKDKVELICKKTAKCKIKVISFDRLF